VGRMRSRRRRRQKGKGLRPRRVNEVGRVEVVHEQRDGEAPVKTGPRSGFAERRF
jgi:hypothetical protein